MSPVTTKRLLKYESPYQSPRFSYSAGNTQTPVMTTYEDSTECTPFAFTRSSSINNIPSQPNYSYIENEASLQFNLTFNRFSPVLKGGWESYRQKYLEGPIIGRGSFGVVKALFSMVHLKSLQKLLPKGLQLRDDQLSEAIKVLGDNSFEFCGLPLCPPTRAVKIMNIKGLKEKTRVKDAIHMLREISIGSWIDHPNVVKVSEIYTNGNADVSGHSNEVFNQQHYTGSLPEDCTEIYIVMENCNGGDLTARPVPEVGREEFIARMFVHVFRALSYLNSLGIAHRDVKPENFLWSSNDPDADIKITDFGLANSPMHNLKTRAGTAYYVAPEIVKYAPRKQYTVKCDAWSAGIMLHVFLLGFCPFHADTDVSTLMRVANDEIDWTDARYSKISPDALDLLRKLLTKDPRKRISTTQALKHPWLQITSFRASFIPMTVEETTGVVDALTMFYRAPVLKQLALCLMVRQIHDKRVEDWRKKYQYLSMLCDTEHFWVNINTVERWLMCATDDYSEKRTLGQHSEIGGTNGTGCDNGTGLRKAPRRRFSVRQSILWKSVSRLNDILNTFNHHKYAINFTEFLAAQMMTELSQRDDLIMETFAGLRRDIQGRQSIAIDARDLKRLLNPMYRCSNAELENILQQSEMIAMSCYIQELDTELELDSRTHHLLKHLLDQRYRALNMELSIEEFFVLIKSTEDIHKPESMVSEYQGRAQDFYQRVRRKLLISELYGAESRMKRVRKKLCRDIGCSQQAQETPPAVGRRVVRRYT